MATEDEQIDYLALSDDDFKNMLPPSSEPTEPEEDQTGVIGSEEENKDPSTVEDDPSLKNDEDESNPSSENDPEDDNPDEDEPKEDQPNSQEENPESLETDPKKEEQDKKESSDELAKDKLKEKSESDNIDYKAFYDQIMTPFKANGKMIELRDPDEAIKLMQMGANFTRKMQEIAPHRKIIMMLENKGLLDQDKLSYLIDLDSKDPEAIKKLVKDSGIDPLDIDTKEESSYQSKNHSVSDEEVAFKTVLEDLKSTQEGMDTLNEIHETWDEKSKTVLWNDPEIMNTIHQQRENGTYSQIVEELERQKTLGTIPTGTPFLQAYKAIGDMLKDQGRFEAKPKRVVDQRAAKPKPEVTNSDKAKAASVSRPTKTTDDKKVVNWLEMSDDEFLKQMNNRV